MVLLVNNFFWEKILEGAICLLGVGKCLCTFYLNSVWCWWKQCWLPLTRLCASVSPYVEEDKENVSLKEVKRRIPLVMEARNRLVDRWILEVCQLISPSLSPVPWIGRFVLRGREIWSLFFKLEFQVKLPDATDECTVYLENPEYKITPIVDIYIMPACDMKAWF